MQCIKESKIMLLGMAYKKDIGDLRELTALKIYDLLLKQQVKLSFHDPYVTYFKRGEEMIWGVPLTEKLLGEVDLVIIVTDHSDLDYEWIEDHAHLSYDTRNATKGKK